MNFLTSLGTSFAIVGVSFWEVRVRFRPQ